MREAGGTLALTTAFGTAAVGLLSVLQTYTGEDYCVEQLQKERKGHNEQLMTNSHRIEKPETRLLQLGR
jgi:hypothetical protein